MEDLLILEKQAVEAAINSNWLICINVNKKIIKIDKENIDAYLRLGFAYFQSNDLKNATKIYKKLLKLQPNNLTAKENLEKIKVLKEKNLSQKNSSIILKPDIFMDVPGKTKTVQLVKYGQKIVLAKLSIGQEVYLISKKRRVEVRTKEKEYIGCLPDDLSKRLSLFIKAGSIFQVLIKEAGLKSVNVFIKEIKRGRQVKKYAAFPLNISANIKNIKEDSSEENDVDEENEEISLYELEKLADNLGEEKEEYGIDHESFDEESEE